MNNKKLLKRILHGSLNNVSFNQMKRLIEAFGFRLDRVSGSHHIFVHPNVHVILNLQSVGGEAKPYQTRQFFEIIESYDLKPGEQE